MDRLAIGLGIMALLVVTCGKAPAQLAPAAPIEEGFETAGPPPGWVFDIPELAPRGKWALDSEVFAEGKQSLRLEPTPANDELFAVAMALEPASWGGKWVQLSVKARCEGLSAPALVTFSDTDKYSSVALINDSDTGGEFRTYSKGFSVPTGLKTLIIGLAVGGKTGRIWYDDLKVELLSGPRVPVETSGFELGATHQVSFAQGKSGLAASFEKPGASTVFEAAGVLKAEAGTLALWVCPTIPVSEIPDFSGLFAWHNLPFYTGLDGAALLFFSQGKQLIFMINKKELTVAPTEWPAGKWHHVAITWGPAGQALYVDGVKGLMGGYTGPLSDPAAVFALGSQLWTASGSTVSRCLIDEARAWALQLTDAQIAELAQGIEQSLPEPSFSESFEGRPVPRLEAPAPSPLGRVAPGAPVEINLRLPCPAGAEGAAKLEYNLRPVGITEPTFESSQTLSLKLDPAGDSNRITLRLPGSLAEGTYWLNVKLTYASGETTTGSNGLVVDSTSGRAWQSEASPIGLAGCFWNVPNHEFFQQIAELGSSWYRLPIKWSEVEPAPDTWDFTRMDELVAWAEEAGVELVPTFQWEDPVPDWSRAKPVIEEDENLLQYKQPPDRLEDWYDYVYTVVSRYKGRITWWIPWNEPNLALYSGEWANPEAYMAMLKTTREASKAADPDSKLLGIGLASTDMPFYKGALDLGALEYCDAIEVHPYVGGYDADEASTNFLNLPDPGRSTWLDGMRNFHNLIEQAGGNHNLWIGEAGWNTVDDFLVPGWAVSEPEQATNLIKVFVETAATPYIEKYLWFSAWEHASFSILRTDFSPKPAAFTFRLCARYLHDAKLVADESTESLKWYVFESPSAGKFAYGWSLGEPVAPPVGASLARKALNQYGNALPAVPATLTKEPVLFLLK